LRQSAAGHIAVGDCFLDQFLPYFRGQLPETELCLPPDRWQHFQKPNLPAGVAGVALGLVGNSNHGASPKQGETAPGRGSRVGKNTTAPRDRRALVTVKNLDRIV